MPDCLIGLGSNLGDRVELLGTAVERFVSLPEVQLLGQSDWHETSPIGGPAGQGAFLNGALLVATSLQPQALLSRLQRIESELGRNRVEHWGPRRIDLDLLLYGREQIETPRLVVPHPSMAWRRFVLAPAAQVAGEMVHPVIDWSVARLLEHLDTTRPYVALAGAPRCGKTRLAEQLSRRLGARIIPAPVVESVSHAGQPGHAGGDWPRELEFLDRRAELLAADGPCWSEPERLWVSDFWFDQSLAHAEANLRQPQYDVFRQQWERKQIGVVAPRLIVLVTPREKDICVDGGNRPLGEAIGALARRPGRGPVLDAGRSPPERLVDDVVAAVEAMETVDF